MTGRRVQLNKPHKKRYASKSSRETYGVSRKAKMRITKRVPHNAVKRNRAERVRQSKMIRDQKRVAVLKERKATGGLSSPPRIIVLFGLSKMVNISSLATNLLTLLASDSGLPRSSTIASLDYKLRVTVLEAPHGDLLTCMEMVKVADFIAFVASASTSHECSFVDKFGFHCLSIFKALGLPSSALLIRDLPVGLKEKHDLRKSCQYSLASLLPTGCKFFAADSVDELHKFMWLFQRQSLFIPHWRRHRPYLMAHKVDVADTDREQAKCTLLLSGYVRARGLSVNQLVHVSGAGDFQLSKIDILNDPYAMDLRKNQDVMDSDGIHGSQVIRSLLPDSLTHEPLLVENIPDNLAGEQTWPTEAEMVEADNNEKQARKKCQPCGPSEYQAAWIEDATDEDVSDVCDDPVDHMEFDERGSTYEQERENNENSEIDTLMSDGEAYTRVQMQEDIQWLRKAHADDEEFPDEVETPLDVPARKRFAKYRGLKSFRTSSWDPKECLPPDYARIFAFENYARTQKHVAEKATEIDNGSANEVVQVGTYIRLHIRDVPFDVASKLNMASRLSPVLACGLLQHESKMSVLHFSIRKHDSYALPIKSKDNLIFHVGFRCFMGRPIFSTNNLNSDKHKMERFLHAGRFSIASLYAPISFPPMPLIVLKSEVGDVGGVAAVAVGCLRNVDPDRIILKKIILTGYPQRVSKFKATVRYMFHNPDDVRWFKPVDVWTKYGRRGRIKEHVGIHGIMKCVFDGAIQQHDTVCMTLYKRTYPKWPEHLYINSAVM